ncbi:hypothetical protein L208DRAFT_770661 [Tricholoma matsutake]|nr:hypothetical protein L208DRAFT_770661 [Tricholoma matsutake 945]
MYMLSNGFRSHMDCVQNDKLDRVIVFGGYNPCLPTFIVTKRSTTQVLVCYDMYMPLDPTSLPVSTLLTNPKPEDRRAQVEPNNDERFPNVQVVAGSAHMESRCWENLWFTKESFGDVHVWQLRIDESGHMMIHGIRPDCLRTLLKTDA